MKKRIFVFLTIMTALVCLFAICASADSINPSTSNEFGTLTTFDDEIGNTGISDKKDDGTVARAVIFDGTNYYTVPTVYLLTEHTKTTGEIFKLNFSELTTKLGLSTSLSKSSIIRFEMPSDITFLAGDDVECLRSCSNMIEVKLNQGLKFWDNGTPKAFSGCKSLVEIDVSMVSFNQSNSVYSIFENCTKLEKVILPEEPYKNGDTPVNYATNYMFNGCTVLGEVENLYEFVSTTTKVGDYMFKGCSKIANVGAWDGVTTIGAYAFNSTAITEVIMPDTVTSMGNHVFAGCASITKIALSKNLVSIGNYSFEGCKALEKVFMPAPWIETNTSKLTFGNGLFKATKSSGVTFYLMCTEEQVATYIDQSAYTDINTDCWKGGTFVYGATLSDKCTIFLGGHEKPTTLNSCTSGGNCVVCATALEGIATGHNLVTIVTFDNGFAQMGVKKTTCQNWEKCTINNVSEELDPIFEAKGYSYKEGAVKSGLSGGFKVNPDSLKEYKDYNPNSSMVVTLLIVNPAYLDENGFFGENGMSTASKGVVQVDISALTYENYEYIISGFDLELMQSLELAFAMVVCDGEYLEVIQKQYGEGETSVAKETYTDKSEISLYSVTVESVAPDMVASLKSKENE